MTGFRKKEPRRSFLPRGSWYWQRPTLAQPRDVLPSANARFTSVFGMGTGGAMLLRSPDSCGGQLDFRCWRTSLLSAECLASYATFGFKEQELFSENYR